MSGSRVRMGKVEKFSTENLMVNDYFKEWQDIILKKTIRKYESSEISYVTSDGVQWRANVKAVMKIRFLHKMTPRRRDSVELI